MDVARLNMSHGSHDDHAAVYTRVRAASDASGHGVGIFADAFTRTVRLCNNTDGFPGTKSISAKPVPRKLGSIPSTWPRNGVRRPSISNGDVGACNFPSNFAFQRSRTEARAIAPKEQTSPHRSTSLSSLPWLSS